MGLTSFKSETSFSARERVMIDSGKHRGTLQEAVCCGKELTTGTDIPLQRVDGVAMEKEGLGEEA